MSDLVRVRRALISVSDKVDLVPFARALADLGVELVSTGGTARALEAAGLDVIPVEDVTGFPEMMDGRVKTLHPSVHGAVLARRDDDAHIAAMNEHGIVPIDLVCVNLYPFERTVQQPDVTESEAIEQIDIGGPAMVRSSAKNHAFVAVVTSPRQYDGVINELRANEGHTTHALRRDLAAAAFSRTAEYDAAISAWMQPERGNGFPPVLHLGFVARNELRYGENPHQRAALYADPASNDPSVVGAELLEGKPLSYNNILDAAAALEAAQDLRDLESGATSAVIVKHTNPCGAATAADPAEAFSRALAGDPMAAYGGIMAISATVDAACARRITEEAGFLEVVVAEAFDADARALLAERWKNLRLLATGSMRRSGARTVSLRGITGGLLVQDTDARTADAGDFRHVAGPAPDDLTRADAAFLFTIVKHLKSNAICVGRERQLLGAGAGQMDRVASCRIAIEKAGDRLRAEGAPAIAASDAFFPFPDGPKLLIDAGVRCIVQPGGAKRDEETFALCEERGVTCLLTGTRHFRH